MNFSSSKFSGVTKAAILLCRPVAVSSMIVLVTLPDRRRGNLAFDTPGSTDLARGLALLADFRDLLRKNVPNPFLAGVASQTPEFSGSDTGRVAILFKIAQLVTGGTFQVRNPMFQLLHTVTVLKDFTGPDWKINQCDFLCLLTVVFVLWNGCKKISI